MAPSGMNQIRVWHTYNLRCQASPANAAIPSQTPDLKIADKFFAASSGQAEIGIRLSWSSHAALVVI